MKFFKRILKSMLSIFILLYISLFLIGIFVSDYLIFQPPGLSYDNSPSITLINGQDGGKIALRYLKKLGAKRVILLSHGNAEDLGDIEVWQEKIGSLGFDVVAYDYSGYGLSSGSPSEKVVYENIEDVYNYLIDDKGYKPEEIIVWGRSLGGGPSIWLASQKKVGALILQSTYTSTFRVMTKIKILPFDKFDNLSRVPKVTAPTLIIHGRLDQVIPFSHGEKLYQTLECNKEFLWLSEAGHNDITFVDPELYYTKVTEFLEIN
ncbi:MAG: alpha/beta hydrolase [Lentisphaeria bacterium]|nr:alpha/beta hydrolase [Lentisphaeria bacterium]